MLLWNHIRINRCISRKCKFLLENIGSYANKNNPQPDYWLETPSHDIHSLAWTVSGYYRNVEKNDVYISNYGVRPVIEVYNGNINYY